MSRAERGVPHRQIHALFHAGTAAGLSDGQLLERFALRRGDDDDDGEAELAFTVLVERHGPTVIQVCRRLLRDPHDADDAFQATFLVLARKAHAIERRDSVASWLYGVALRVAADARYVAARRRMHEQRAAAGRSEAVHPPEPDDLGGVLAEEIGRLPEPFRAPVVLCYLEGCTCEEAARRLGWPIGTVKSRLTRARRRLQDRLRRRGLAPDASPGPLAPTPAAPALPPALVRSTVAAASRFASIPSAAVGSAALLAQGVIRSMFLARSLKLAALALVLATAAPSATLLAQKAGSGRRPGGGAGSDRPGRYSTTRVEPGTLRITQVAPGILQPGRASDVYNRVPGSRTIIKVLPEGSRVKKGQLVCQLDPSDIANELALLVASGAVGPEVVQLQKQIENCQMVASENGIVLHANDPSRFGPVRPPQIAQGATVRERQLIFKVYDPNQPLWVRTRVPEPVIHRVDQFVSARIRIEALGGAILNGRVISVGRLPEPTAAFDVEGAEVVRVYPTLVALDKVDPRLRIGMSAQVELLLKELANVLTVPIDATFRFDGKDHVAVSRPDGGFDWREVSLGERNTERVEVTEGLKPGESIILSAGRLRHK